jgi:hypothetical protein
VLGDADYINHRWNGEPAAHSPCNVLISCLSAQLANLPYGYSDRNGEDRPYDIWPNE